MSRIAPPEITLMSHTLLVLLIVSFCFGLVVSLLQRQAHNRSTSRCIMAMLLITSTLAIGYTLQQEQPLWREWLFTLLSLQMCCGPVLWYYTKLQTQEQFQWHPKLLVHLLPAPIFAAIWLFQLPLSPSDLLYLPNHQSDPTSVQCYRLVHKVSAWCSLMGYSLASLKMLQPHAEKMKASYSELSQVNLGWLKALSFAVLGTTSLSILSEFSRLLGVSHEVNGGDIMTWGPLIFMLLLIRYGLKQPDIYQRSNASLAPRTVHSDQPLEASDSAANHELPPKKYQTSSLTQAEAAQLWQKLQQLVIQQQPHLEPGLKISELAVLLETSVNHLSETINGYAQRSFYDYINGLRIEEACRILQDPTMDHYSVTDVGYQAGFNAISTFYTHFKKSTGMTPKQYRARLAPIESRA